MVSSIAISQAQDIDKNTKKWRLSDAQIEKILQESAAQHNNNDHTSNTNLNPHSECDVKKAFRENSSAFNQDKSYSWRFKANPKRFITFKYTLGKDNYKNADSLLCD